MFLRIFSPGFLFWKIGSDIMMEDETQARLVYSYAQEE
jgi:hypothetical protein